MLLQPVSPTLPASVIAYPRIPDTIIMMPRSPVAAPFHLPSELTSPASTVNAAVWLPAPPSPAVTTTRLVLPLPPAAPRLSTDVSDRHMLDSHPVDPCRTPALVLDTPRPLPITVTLLCSPAIVFPTDVPDTSGPSYEIASLADPVTDPSVTATLVLPPRPIPPLHCTVVSDIHALISHPVIPTRPPALAPSVQKLSPTIRITIHDAPRMFTPSSPPASVAPASSPASPSCTPPSRPAPLTTALSYDTIMLVLITCPSAVIVTCNVLNTPAGVRHATLLSDAHPVDSPAVMPTAADIVCPCSPSPDPITIISSPPGSITFDKVCWMGLK